LEGDRNEQNKYEEKYLEDRFFYFFTIPYYHIHFYYSFIHTHTDEMSHGTISEITKETSRVFGWEIWLFFFKKLPHFFLKSMYFLLLESVACALKEWYLKKKLPYLPPKHSLQAHICHGLKTRIKLYEI
jgi:hypothetical protein